MPTNTKRAKAKVERPSMVRYHFDNFMQAFSASDWHRAKLNVECLQDEYEAVLKQRNAAMRALKRTKQTKGRTKNAK